MGMRAGFYREVAPPPDLAPYVACTWTRVVGAEHAGGPEPIIPDACADLIVVAQDVHIAGPADRAVWLRLRPETRIVGVRFRPGGARDVLRCDLDSLRNEHLALTDVVGPSARELGGVVEHEQPERALLDWVRLRVSGRRSPEAPLDIARLLTRARSLDDVMATLGWSARRLHRAVSRASGYGPKLVQRILRLQYALRLAHDGAGTLAAVAAAAGFADQAHMTREFVALTDQPPRDHVARADPRVGRWLVSDLFKTAGAV